MHCYPLMLTDNHRRGLMNFELQISSFTTNHLKTGPLAKKLTVFLGTSHLVFIIIPHFYNNGNYTPKVVLGNIPLIKLSINRI